MAKVFYLLLVDRRGVLEKKATDAHIVTTSIANRHAAIVIVDDVVLLRTQKGEFIEYSFIGIMPLTFKEIILTQQEGNIDL